MFIYTDVHRYIWRIYTYIWMIYTDVYIYMREMCVYVRGCVFRRPFTVKVYKFP